MEEKLTSKQQLDQLLGIKEDQSIDSFLDSLTAEADSLSSLSEGIAEQTKEGLAQIDQSLSAIVAGAPNSILTIRDIDASMKEVEDLISLSKKMFKHIYENFTSSDLIDSELVGSTSKLLESIHVNIAEFVSMYRDKQRFIDKIKLMVMQQEQRKEMELIKHKHQLELMQARFDTKAIDGDGENINYRFEDIIKQIDEQDTKD